jgi:hypothetical protein
VRTSHQQNHRHVVDGVLRLGGGDVTNTNIIDTNKVQGLFLSWRPENNHHDEDETIASDIIETTTTTTMRSSLLFQDRRAFLLSSLGAATTAGVVLSDDVVACAATSDASTASGEDPLDAFGKALSEKRGGAWPASNVSPLPLPVSRRTTDSASSSGASTSGSDDDDDDDSSVSSAENSNSLEQTLQRMQKKRSINPLTHG